MRSYRLHPTKESQGTIGSFSALCIALDLKSNQFADALAIPSEQRYTRKVIPKKDGTDRVVYNPHHLIRKIQHRLNKRLFSVPEIIRWPDYIFGSIPNDIELDSESEGTVSNRDYVNCARQHCGAKSILTVDIKNFFDNVHQDHVCEIFTDFFCFPIEVAEILADLCCHRESLPQGALTSSYLATLCLYKHEGALVKKLRHKSLTYTRFVDDITISTKVANYEFGYALSQIERTLSEAGLPLNLQKTRMQYASMKPLIVHGLRVDFDEPRLPPEDPRKIRAAVKNLELLAASPGYRASRAYRKDFNRCMGRVNKLGRVGHSQHSALLSRLKKILPLPSHMDIERAEKQIASLKNDLLKPGYQDTIWFRKRFFVASERLGVLKRSFPKKADELRNELRAISPPKNHV